MDTWMNLSGKGWMNDVIISSAGLALYGCCGASLSVSWDSSLQIVFLFSLFCSVSLSILVSFSLNCCISVPVFQRAACEAKR